MPIPSAARLAPLHFSRVVLLRADLSAPIDFSMFISIGQGGNQLAACMWQRVEQQQAMLAQEAEGGVQRAAVRRSQQSNPYSAAASSASSAPLPSIPPSPWFALDGHAHALMLDAEPKVVAQLQGLGKQMHASKQQQQQLGDKRATKKIAASTAITANSSATRTLFRPSNLLYEQYGRGNNCQKEKQSKTHCVNRCALNRFVLTFALFAACLCSQGPWAIWVAKAPRVPPVRCFPRHWNPCDWSSSAQIWGLGATSSSCTLWQGGLEVDLVVVWETSFGKLTPGTS